MLGSSEIFRAFTLQFHSHEFQLAGLTPKTFKFTIPICPITDPLDRCSDEGCDVQNQLWMRSVVKTGAGSRKTAEGHILTIINLIGNFQFCTSPKNG